MKSRQSILNKTDIFYNEVEVTRKGQKTRLQTDQEFKRRKIFDLNNKFNVDMFLTAVRVGKAFAAGTKIKRIKEKYI